MARKRTVPATFSLDNIAASVENTDVPVPNRPGRAPIDNPLMDSVRDSYVHSIGKKITVPDEESAKVVTGLVRSAVNILTEQNKSLAREEAGDEIEDEKLEYERIGARVQSVQLDNGQWEVTFAGVQRKAYSKRTPKAKENGAEQETEQSEPEFSNA